MSEGTNPLGNIYVSNRAIATVACQSALSCYGVVGLAPKNLAEGLAQVLIKDPIVARVSNNPISIATRIIKAILNQNRSVSISFWRPSM